MSLAAIAPLAAGRHASATSRTFASRRPIGWPRSAAELGGSARSVTHGATGWLIEPAAAPPALVKSYADHRMAMSFAVLGSAAGGVTIEDPACVAKTYPGFFLDDVAAIYAAAGVPFLDPSLSGQDAMAIRPSPRAASADARARRGSRRALHASASRVGGGPRQIRTNGGAGPCADREALAGADDARRAAAPVP